VHRSPMSFAPHEALAALLLPHVDGAGDGSHDLSHLGRVWRNAFRIAAEEEGREGSDDTILAAAVLLHDCVTVEKGSPLRSQASRLAGERAVFVLSGPGLNWTPERIEEVRHAVEAHSFSAGIEPRTRTARILQDADRLDALGMIGAARCFYTAGRMGSALYDPEDPKAERRPLDDRRFALDHFGAKLLGLASGFRTAAGARLAAVRHERLVRCMEEFLDEA